MNAACSISQLWAESNWENTVCDVECKGGFWYCNQGSSSASEEQKTEKKTQSLLDTLI